MILINKTSSNTVCLTLSEKTTLTTAVYLFEFIKDGSPGIVKSFIAQDIAINKYRINEFVITESATENLLTGTISLNDGKYQYNVYEQVSSTNLTPSLALNKIETGRVEVKSIAAAIPAFNGQQTNIKQFNG